MTRPSPFLRARTGRVSVVAHRGLSATEPENTMRAFRAAAAAGCDLIELDVHLTRDAELVVIHDESLERTTDGTGLVRERTLAELRGLDAGRGERIPTLDEVAAWARAERVTLSVEIKQPAPVSGAPPYDRIAERVVDLLGGHDLLRGALVHSFDHPTVRRLRELAPDLATAVSYGGGTFVEPLSLGRAAGVSGIHPWWAWASPALAEAAHAEGIHVHAWGLAEPHDEAAVAALVRAGVDSLDAADPRALRALLATLGA
ncbi:MAG TPA: glycerophosphodiester phosphodiesterase family protein [Candidatus Limnocylindria bacterium]|nr:glycerophosphodiester phosphodiesterase family protein [Candidatus Limnocylindria bacterium]